MIFRVEWMRGIVRAAAALWLAVAFSCLASHVASAKSPKSDKSKSNVVCEIDPDLDDDDGDDDEDKPPRVPRRFLINGTCTKLSGEMNLIGQNVLKKSGALLPLLTQRGAFSAPDPFVATVDFSPRVEMTRKTAWGNVNSVFELKAQRDSTGGAGLVNLSESYVSWAGWKAGYTDSLMNFWTGDDFQFSANAPSRSVGIAAYEFKLTDNLKIAAAKETGMPTSTGTDVRFIPVTFLDPVISARVVYEKDDFSVHLSGMMHELDTSATDRPLLARLGITGEASGRGWAATAGMAVPLPLIHEDDKVTVQATYALNASSYLGTAADLSTLSGFAPPGTQTRGWSALAAYHHVLAEGWELNLFASRIRLDIALALGQPRIDVERYAANVKWEAAPGFTVGTELGYIDVQVDPNGVIGVLNSSSGRGLVGYLFATWTF